MRLLLLGAFPYPHDQGSQVYFQEQAIALRAAGARPTLMTYGPARTFDPRLAGRDAAEHWRALDGFEQRPVPGWARPRSLRSGPSWTKPIADLGLAMTLRDAFASQNDANDAYDAILAHNAEAAVTGLLSLPRRRPPLVYCVHTLLGRELSTYFKSPKKMDFSFDPREMTQTRRTLTQLDRFGAGLDRWIGARVDGWIALTQSAERVMRGSGDAPGALVPPPLPDPDFGDRAFGSEPGPEAVARRHGLDPGRFFLYSGNLDAYQELEVLSAAATALSARSASPPVLVVASHRRGSGPAAGPPPGWRDAMAGVEFRWIDSARDMQALLATAQASLVMRRAEGGFPIKLVNSLAAGTPPIVFCGGDWGLTHERDALICPADRPGARLAEAIERLATDDRLAKRLSAGARALYFGRHRPERAADATLALVREVVSAGRR